MKVFAVIPARGGSKGVPRKNVRLLAGRPLFLHAVEQARASRRVDALVVSTEDEEIADLARRDGVDVVDRPPALAADDTPTLPVLQHATEQQSYRPEVVVTLQPTSPLRRGRHIDAAVERLEGAWDAVVSVCRAGHHPHKMFKLDAEQGLRPFVEGADPGAPRQALPPVYRENGAIYATRTDVLIEGQSLRGERTRAYEMSEEDSVDIDTPLDFDRAELLLSKRQPG